MSLRTTKYSESKSSKQAILNQMQQLLKKKGLDPNLFQFGQIKVNNQQDDDRREIKLEDDIREHIKWAKRIYHSPYLEDQSKKQKPIARLIHGITHVARAAALVPVVVNMHRRFADKDYENFTEEDIKLTQLAAVFHDAARENEGVDLWDAESGLMFYFYLTEVLKVNHDQAKLLAEAIANKDNRKKPYQKFYKELIINEQGELAWKTIKQIPKNKYIEPLREVDTFEIHRARAHFKGKKLDMHAKFAKKSSPTYQKHFLKELSGLRLNIRSLLENQGDGYARININVKKLYEHAESPYDAITADFQRYPFLKAMYNGGKLVTNQAELQQPLIPNPPDSPNNVYNPEDPNFIHYANSALDGGKCYVRCVTSPYGVVPKLLHGKIETQVQKELRKVDRMPDQLTKSNKLGKHGSKKRSASRLGEGGTMFSDAGYLMIGLDTNDIHKVSISDADSGFSKKEGSKLEKKFSPEEIKEQLDKFEETMMEGGGSCHHGAYDWASTHTEVICDIKRKLNTEAKQERKHDHPYKAVVYTSDPNFYNHVTLQQPHAKHPNAPLLQALMLQKEFENRTKIKLPLLEYSAYSATPNQFRLRKNLNDEEIIKLWVETCADYINKELKQPGSNVKTLSIEQIQINSICNPESRSFAMSHVAADHCFEKELRQKINKAIKEKRDELLQLNEEKIKNALLDVKTDIFDARNQLFIGLLEFPHLLNNQNIIENILRQIDEVELFKGPYLYLPDYDDSKSKDKRYSTEIIYYQLLIILQKKIPDPDFFASKLKKFKKQVVNVLNKKFKEFEKYKAASSFKEGMNIILHFRLDDSLKNKFINTYFNILATDNSLDIMEFRDLVCAGENFNLNCQNQVLINKIQHKIKKFGIKAKTIEEIARVFIVAKQFNLPLSEKKAIFLKYISGKISDKDLREICDYVGKEHPDVLNDKEVFLSIIKKIYSFPHNLKPLEKSHYLLNAFKIIKFYLPAKEFSSWQKEIVNQYISELHKDIKTCLQEFQERAQKKVYYYVKDFSYYFFAADEVMLPLSEQRKTIGFLLEIPDFQATEILNLVKSADPETFNEPTLFHQLIERLLQFAKEEVDFSEKLEVLEDVMPGEEFSPQQIAQIQKLQSVKFPDAQATKVAGTLFDKSPASQTPTAENKLGDKNQPDRFDL